MEAKVFMKDQTAAPLLTREQVRLKLNERGYPLTASYFNKISLPSVNAGPPAAKWWGKRPLYRLDEALAWAEARCGSSPGKLVTGEAEMLQGGCRSEHALRRAARP
jgi:hypothetical protein